MKWISLVGKCLKEMGCKACPRRYDDRRTDGARSGAAEGCGERFRCREVPGDHQGCDNKPARTTSLVPRHCGRRCSIDGLRAVTMCPREMGPCRAEMIPATQVEHWLLLPSAARGAIEVVAR